MVGVDNDASMLATAQSRGPAVTWIRADVTALFLDRHFDVVLMAGNVPLFTPPGAEAAPVAAAPDTWALVAGLVGFPTGPGLRGEAYDEDCAAAGLDFAQRWATWDRQPCFDGSAYAVRFTVPGRRDGPSPRPGPDAALTGDGPGLCDAHGRQSEVVVGRRDRVVAEGPVWCPDGTLIVTCVDGGLIHRVLPDEGRAVVVSVPPAIRTVPLGGRRRCVVAKRRLRFRRRRTGDAPPRPRF